jgi:hypothetical protein
MQKSSEKSIDEVFQHINHQNILCFEWFFACLQNNSFKNSFVMEWFE